MAQQNQLWQKEIINVIFALFPSPLRAELLPTSPVRQELEII